MLKLVFPLFRHRIFMGVPLYHVASHPSHPATALSQHGSTDGDRPLDRSVGLVAAGPVWSGLAGWEARKKRRLKLMRWSAMAIYGNIWLVGKHQKGVWSAKPCEFEFLIVFGAVMNGNIWQFSEFWMMLFTKNGTMTSYELYAFVAGFCKCFWLVVFKNQG